VKRGLFEVVLIAAALLVGRMTKPVAAPIEKSECVVTSEVHDIDRVALRAEIREAVRLAMPTCDAHAVAVAPVLVPSTPTVEGDDAFERGQSLVAAAQRARRWTENDVSELRPLMAQMSDEQRGQILRTFLPMVNRGEVVVEFVGAPF
jgi:hypothetical protein